MAPVRNRKTRTGAVALLVLSLLAAGQAGASGMPVFDGAAFTQKIEQFFEQVAHWKKQIDHQAAQGKHMQQQLIKLEQMFMSARLSVDNVGELRERRLDEGVDKRCARAGLSPIASLFAEFNIDFSGDIPRQQQRICVQIVTLENMKYNEYVELMRHLDSSSQKDVERVGRQMAASDEEGKMTANLGNASLLTPKVISDIEAAQTNAKIYDELIETAKTQQRELARRALKGERSLVGQVVRAGALCLALKADVPETECGGVL